MDEYTEDVDALLDAEDEDEVLDRRRGPELMDLEDIDGGDSDEERNRRQLELELGTGNLGNDLDDLDIDLNLDSNSENESEDEARNAAKAAERSEKLTKLLETPPGLKLFNRPDDQMGFKYFNLDNLNLEADFGYSRRGKLKGHGYSDQTIDEILTNKLSFIRHLMPEAQSVLLCDKQDFKAIMDFLFYSISVCSQRRMSELLVKSFFDLAKNYGFSWKLGLRHIVTVLTNYGIDDQILNEDHFNKHLASHRQALKAAGVNLSSRRFKVTYAHFLTARKKRTVEFTPFSKDEFKFCLTRFILLVSEFSMGMPTRIDLRHKTDWSDQCVFIFIFSLLGTDRMFIQDYRVFDAISTMFIYHFDSMPTEIWHCGTGKPEYDRDKNVCFGSNSFPKTLSTMIHDFQGEDKIGEIRNWKRENILSGNNSSKVDEGEHGLNIIHKLELIPPSFRGSQVRRFLAFLYLQTCLQKSNIATSNNPSIIDIAKMPDVYNAVYLKILWNAEYSHFSALLVIVKLCDMIVGQEKQEAFSADKIDSIRKVRKEILEKMNNKLPTVQRALKTGKGNVLLLSQLSSHLQIVMERWRTGCGGD